MIVLPNGRVSVVRQKRAKTKVMPNARVSVLKNLWTRCFAGFVIERARNISSLIEN